MKTVIAVYTIMSFSGFPLGMSLAAASADPDSLWVQICGSGTYIQLNLGGEQEPPIPAHNAQACHAVCCRNDDGEDV